MRELPTVVEVGDLALPATCTLPEEGPVIGGIVPLHGATAPARDFFLYTHLASVASREGWAVLRYDRRPVDRGTIPFEVQAADAIAASDRLREVAQLPREPIGIWGVSQGAWSATVAAADSDDVAFLILVGYSGMSPGEQMRYFTANRLREHGHGERALAALAALRDTFEGFLRGDLDHTTAQRHVDEARSQPWFEHSWVPAELPQRSEVSFPGLFDFEPIGPLRRARCPTLAIWGADDVEVPPDVGRDVIERARREVPATTRCEVLDGAGHTLTVGGEDDVAALHPRYEPLLIEWLHAQAGGPGDR